MSATAADVSTQAGLTGGAPPAVRTVSDTHLVQFYGDERFLAERVVRFVSPTLRTGGGAVLVATYDHLGAILGILERDGTLSGMPGMLDCHSAEILLANFMVAGVPDEELFRRVVGTVVERAVRTAGSQPVQVYGEMVDLLWKAGNIDAALRLEQLWEDLARTTRFSLLCAYELKAFSASQHEVAFKQICQLHSHVSPSETYASISEAPETLRAVALLEQRASSLEREIERRLSAEAAREELLRAQTVARARAERTVARMSALHDLTASLSRAVSLPEIAHIAVEKACAAVDAKRAALWLADEAATTLCLTSESGIPELSVHRFQRLTLDGSQDMPGVTTFRQARPIWIESRADFAAAYPHLVVALPASAEDYALACLPVLAAGAPIGCLSLTFDEAHEFDPEERVLHSVIAEACAQALERGRLFESERRRRLQAEGAIRAREEILAVVSHDLRNPLGAVLAASANLLSAAASDGANKRVRVNAERIQRNATRMVRFIDDLVDFGSIQAGQLQLAVRPCDVGEVLSATLETFKPLADERAIHLATEMEPGLPGLSCDLDRVVQALSNLLSNALKFTPGGGVVAIEVGGGPKEVVFHVRDTGPGIDPEDLPHLFERYFRGRDTPYKGTGLGLTIAKGIVDAHRGRLWVESQRGTGARFSFTLPSSGP
jgi:signal transduction histidine kinase